MSCGLTKGRTEGCFDNIGGVKNIYLFNYVDYPFTAIVRDGQEVTRFPSSTLYKYEPQGANFSEQISNDANGVKYDQTLSFTLTKQDRLTTDELNRAQQIDLRYLVEFNDGLIKIGGLYNGAKITQISIISGGSKGDLNGYNITITGSEEVSASFTSFNVITSNLLQLENDFYYLLENGSSVILE